IISLDNILITPTASSPSMATHIYSPPQCSHTANLIFFHQYPDNHELHSFPTRTLFRSQKELTKMQLDNQKEIAEMQNETQKEIAGIQSATSRQNTKDQVYAQNEMLAYQQKESTARVASIMENTNLSKQQQVSE